MNGHAALSDGRVPVVLSAHAEDLVGTDAAAILRYLDGRNDTAPSDVAYTLLRTRRLRRHRAVIRAAGIDELTAGLRALADGEDHPLVTRAAAPQPGSRRRIAFVFPGQGSQWPSMGVESYRLLDEYRAEVDRCAAEFGNAGVASPLDYLLADPSSGATTNEFSQVQIQGAQFAHSVALARVWRSYGVVPDITVGHSLGEIGAAYVADAITLPEAVGIVIARATVLDRLTGPYRVAVLGITPEEATDVISETPGWLELSVVNSPSSVAVSGETEAVAAAVRAVAARGAFAKEIEMWFPAHTTALDGVRDQLDALLPDGRFAEAPVQFIGSATADVVEAGTDFAEYWYMNLRTTVRFDRAIARAARRGARVFVELSAHPALLFNMAELLDDSRGVVVVGSGRRDEQLPERLAANVTTVALADPGYRWADRIGEHRAVLPDFPFAPMRAEHLWAQPDPLPPVAGLKVAEEQWHPVATPGVRGGRRIAVVELDAECSVADTLRAAAERIESVEVVTPAEAEVLVVIAPMLSEDDPVVAAEELGRRIDSGLLRYPGMITETTRDVWLVTGRGERVPVDRAAALPVGAAMAAMHRSIAFEHPDQNFRQLDVPLDLNADGGAAAIGAVSGSIPGTADIALRTDGSAVALWRRGMRDGAPTSPPWPADVLEDVVITGGTGAVGLQFARRLAALGARRIVLLSRTGLDDNQAGELPGGIEIVAPRCDLTDAAQLRNVAAEFGGRGASLVVHAAAAAAIGIGDELTGADAQVTFAAKLTGAANLLAAWPMRPEARILLCSSVSGLWGGLGHAAYAAANRLLDVMADRLRSQGLRCTSVRWGLWPGAGVIDAHEIARVERAGLRAMAPDRAVDTGLHDFAGDPLVFSADAQRLALFLDLGTDTDTGEAAPVPRQPGDTDEDPPVDAVGVDARDAVRTALGDVLKLSGTTGLDLDASLLDLGVDSLLAVDLRKKLKKATGRSVPLATLLGGVTATELIEHLERPEKETFSRD
ncbi:mycobactin polyketide synthase MbtD [Mycolicibacterium goodii]|uniref:Mycobactin polyketide synthase MbtD n=1 Tax=Mycolicibacterium goodii TaxID=134601 RepID=A0ABS6HG31_MYCGD|nr:mycobactin polyketide synthase MbtD [Mycolicibacterium goodii]MBU8821639.1 mycobactin polyketide synthase MbtD [Mycolicibacterium goodii]MBU8836037.1 mycobactin polyketide synthase MbtD [Mycolicibacterium goodii]ULN45787.1 mycobactin polyketide synthase MbtD [Mycolicibacterium goodii]